MYNKYKLVEKNEHEILMDELFPKINNKIANDELRLYD